MINIVAVLTVVAMLESSYGRNMKHPDPDSHGWLGMSDVAIKDVNRHYGTHYTAKDTLDKDKAFEMAAQYIAMYHQPEWTITDILLMWRCGPTGAKHPTLKQLKYVKNGLELYKRELQGKDITK